MFPYQEVINVQPQIKIHYLDLIKKAEQILTPERQKKIRKVASERCFAVQVVLENIYDRGNASAVMRTAEALGFTQFNMIETGEKFKNANRVTQGAEKWIDVNKWKTTSECIQKLKKDGYQVVVTHLDEKAKAISEVDFSKPTAFVLGNEKDGISSEMIELADHKVIIPMSGFVQSFNISVAGALGLYHIYQDRSRRLGKSADVSVEQAEILTAEYYARSIDSLDKQIEIWLQRNEIKRV